MSNKNIKSHMDDDIKLTLADVVAEITQEHISKSLLWSGKELAANEELANKITDILLKNSIYKAVAMGISQISGVDVAKVGNDLNTGVVMGISIIIEMLNDREQSIPPSWADEEIPGGSTTIN